MSTAELKSELIKNINSTKDVMVLNQIKQIFEVDYLEKDVRIFTSEQQQRINISMEQYLNGAYISNDGAQKEIQAWVEK